LPGRAGGCYLGREYCCLCMRRESPRGRSRRRPARDCGKDRALNSGHRAVPAVFPALHAAGVEGEIGRFRRRHMTPVPRAAALAELNQMLADVDEVDEHRPRSRPASRPSGRPPPARCLC